ncbi:MAG TPA: PRC-barrel domain-containing protein [Povalibacter sp.]
MNIFHALIPIANLALAGAALAQASADPAETANAIDADSTGKLPTRVQQNATGGVVGTQVVTKSNQPLGTVVEAVFDTEGKPTFVVVSNDANLTAIPMAAATAMKDGSKIVVGETRLALAPHVQRGEWKDSSRKQWQQAASRYWGRG